MTLADRLHRALCRTGFHLWGKPRVNHVRVCRICRKRNRLGVIVKPTQSDRLVLTSRYATPEELAEEFDVDFDEVRRSRKLRPEDFPAVTQGPSA